MYLFIIIKYINSMSYTIPHSTHGDTYLRYNINELYNNLEALEQANVNEIIRIETSFNDLSNIVNDLSTNFYNFNLLNYDDASFNHVEISGNLIINGDLQVNGTEKIVNTTTLEVSTNLIKLATGAISQYLTDGAGIEVSGNKTFLYDYTNDIWESNIDISASNITNINASLIDLSTNYYTYKTENDTSVNTLHTNLADLSTNYYTKINNSIYDISDDLTIQISDIITSFGDDTAFLSFYDFVDTNLIEIGDKFYIYGLNSFGGILLSNRLHTCNAKPAGGTISSVYLDNTENYLQTDISTGMTNVYIVKYNENYVKKSSIPFYVINKINEMNFDITDTINDLSSNYYTFKSTTNTKITDISSNVNTNKTNISNLQTAVDDVIDDLGFYVNDISSRLWNYTISNDTSVNNVLTIVDSNYDELIGAINTLGETAEYIASDLTDVSTNLYNLIIGDVSINKFKINDVSTNLNTYITNNDTSVNNVYNTTTDLSTNYYTYKLNNDTSVNNVYNTTTDLSTNLNNLIIGDVSNNKFKINDVSGRVLTNATNINDVSGRVLTNATNINDVSGRVFSNTTNINDVSGRVLTNTTNINDISGRVLTNTTTINDVSGLANFVNYQVSGLDSSVTWLINQVSGLQYDFQHYSPNLQQYADVSFGYGKFSKDLVVDGSFTVQGNLYVNGTHTIINSSTIDVSDRTILLASKASTAVATHNSGLEVSGNKTFLYDYYNNRWTSNIDIVSNNIGLYAFGNGAFKSNGTNGNSNRSIALGYLAGESGMGGYCCALGNEAGKTTMGSSSVAIGSWAGRENMGASSVAIGSFAGQSSQGIENVAIGYNSGNNYQGTYSIAVGGGSGFSYQGSNSVAVGYLAGRTRQQSFSIAIGRDAGYLDQSNNCVAIGYKAGQTQQGNNSVAIGNSAGANTQGKYSVAIGNKAGETNQHNNTIILNAQTDISLNTDFSNAFYVKPIRNVSNIYSLYYNPTKGEITYDLSGGGGGADLTGIINDISQIEFDISGIPNILTTLIDLSQNVVYPLKASHEDLSLNFSNLNIGTNIDNSGVRSVISGGIANYGVALGLNSIVHDQLGISIGSDAASGYSGVGIGESAGKTSQGANGVAISTKAGFQNQAYSAIAIGYNAGYIDQSNSSIAIGRFSGKYSQKEYSVAIGNESAETNQGIGSVALGAYSGNNYQGNYSVAVGYSSGFLNQGSNSVTIGNNSNASDNSVAIGNASKSSLYAIALGDNAVVNNNYSIAIGKDSLINEQLGIAIGYYAGSGYSGVGIGFEAGKINQKDNAVAIGSKAGFQNQGYSAVSLGYNTGYIDQSLNAVAIGSEAGYTNQGGYGIAIGNQAGYTNQGVGSVALGAYSAQTNQGNYSVAVGYGSGNLDQSNNSICIGYYANSTFNKSIVLNANNVALDASYNSALYISSIRNNNSVDVSHSLFYNPSTKEVTYKKPAIISKGINGIMTNMDNDVSHNSIAFGYQAGKFSNTTYNISLGTRAGYTNQGFDVSLTAFCIAIGNSAGSYNQYQKSICLGCYAGSNHAGMNSICIGTEAGINGAGTSSVLIGYEAGFDSSHNNCIVLNATGNILNSQQNNSCYIAPIRNYTSTDASNILIYDSKTKEIQYATTTSIIADLSFVVNDILDLSYSIPAFQLYVFDSNANTVATLANTPYKVNYTAGTATNEYSSSFTVNTTTNLGRVTYTGSKTRFFKIDNFIAFKCSSTSYVDFFLRKNGTTSLKSTTSKQYSTTDIINITISSFISLAQNDYIELYLSSFLASRTYIVRYFNLTAIAMPN